MEQQSGIEKYIEALEAQLLQEEGQVNAWLKRAIAAQDIDSAIQLKEVQGALLVCLDKINPTWRQQLKRKKRIAEIFGSSDKKNDE